MKITTYKNAASFLDRTQTALESNEAGNSLMLGICARLARHPERVSTPPCLKTVEEDGALVIAAMMTPPHNLVMYGHNGQIKSGASALAEHLHTEGLEVPGVFGPDRAPAYFVKRWVDLAQCGSRLDKKMLVYALRINVDMILPKGHLRTATESDIDLLSAWWFSFHYGIYGKADEIEARKATQNRISEKDLYVWEDGHPVSMAIKTRPTRNGISISMVYTPPELRGKGYATACVSTLSRSLLNQGWKFCALFADAANKTANRLYSRIGYRPVCEYREYRFT